MVRTTKSDTTAAANTPMVATTSPSLMLLKSASRATGSLKIPSRYAVRLRLPQGISAVQKPSSDTMTSANSGRIVVTTM